MPELAHSVHVEVPGWAGQCTLQLIAGDRSEGR